MAEDVGASAKMYDSKSIIIIVNEFLKRFWRAQSRIMLKNLFINVVDDYLIFILFLIFLVNEGHKID